MVTYNLEKYHFENKYDVINSNNINPQLFMGFQTYYSDNIKKLNTELRKRFKGKSRVYSVINPYNNIINEYENSIQMSFINKYKIVSNDVKLVKKQNFYKMWECIKQFDILDNAKNVLCFDEYSNLCSKILKKKSSVGNLINPSIKGNYDCILNNFHLKISIQQEKQYILYLINFANVINNLNENGNIICKLFNLYMKPTIEIIFLMSLCFKNVHIYIPYTCEQYRNEKFLICKNYKKNNDILKILKLIKEIIEKENVLMINIPLPENYVDLIKKINLDTQLTQTININKLEKYVLEQNYYGEAYNKYRQEQIIKSNEWIKKYI